MAVKDSKTILSQHFLVGVLMQIGAIALITLPALDQYRARAAELLRIPESTFWLIVIGLLIAGNALIARRLHRRVVIPLKDLVKQTRLSQSSFAFKKVSRNAEEDSLKHFIESLTLRQTEMEQEMARMQAETDLEGIRDRELAALDKVEELQREIDSLKQALNESETKLSHANASTDALETELEALRHAPSMPKATFQPKQIDREVLDRIKTPLILINHLSWKLAKTWADTPLSKMRDGFIEINKQSDAQLEQLSKLSPDDQEIPEEPELDDDFDPLDEHPFSLEAILEKTVKEASQRSSNTKISYELDPLLRHHIEDENFENLLRELTQIALDQSNGGSLSISVTRHERMHVYRFDREGTPRQGRQFNLSSANRTATLIGGRVEVSVNNGSELLMHLKRNVS